MLTDISIRNFAIIDSLHISLQAGLNVLTGETGAGKSIIIDAVGLILGGRASTDLIRAGEEEAVVEAVFDIRGHESIAAALKESGIEDGDGEILVKRILSRSGRNRIFINGGLATGGVLEKAAGLLVNIYGQHESQTLLRSENHLDILDEYGALVDVRKAYHDLYEEYRAAKENLARLDEGARDAAKKIDLLSFQVNEIAVAALRPDEEEILERERNLLANSGKLLDKSNTAYETLYGGEVTVTTLLGRVRHALSELAGIDTAVADISETVENAAIQLDDAAMQLRDYTSRIDVDPGRLQEVEDRLHLIRRLKKKYGASVAEVLRYKDELDEELYALTNREEVQADLQRKAAELREAVLASGAKLTQLRKKAASSFSSSMERELHDLAMKNARFEVKIVSTDEPRAHGLERVEFLFAPNPGEGAKPLAKIASGGELSRMMLGIKQIHPESAVPTLIFDEVDTGIGGATSVVVGEKLKNVSRRQQVLCITHLPQVAAFADHHYMVEKSVSGGRTATSVRRLEGDERVAEMARMLGGRTISARTLEHAREMIVEAAGSV